MSSPQSVIYIKHRVKRQSISRSVPKLLKPWLSDEGSLTEKLVERSDGDFRVQVLCSEMATPSIKEAKALQIPYRQKALVREVILLGRDLPWVYARSVIPSATLAGSLNHITDLGSKPLGALLFSDPTIQRGKIDYLCLSKTDLPNDIGHPQPAWGRRSVFWAKGRPLLVGEFFLDPFLQELSL